MTAISQTIFMFASARLNFLLALSHVAQVLYFWALQAFCPAEEADETFILLYTAVWSTRSGPSAGIKSYSIRMGPSVFSLERQ